LPSFETAAQEGGLLRMRLEIFHRLKGGASSVFDQIADDDAG